MACLRRAHRSVVRRRSSENNLSNLVKIRDKDRTSRTAKVDCLVILVPGNSQKRSGHFTIEIFMHLLDLVVLVVVVVFILRNVQMSPAASKIIYARCTENKNPPIGHSDFFVNDH